MVEPSTVVSNRHGAVLEVTLNRPERLNAFTRQLHEELIATLRAAEADASCKVILVTGAGKGFCAGQDLTERVFVDGVPPDLSENLVERYNPLVDFMRNSRLVFVAAVNGAAAGAGASFALACDIVVAARSAKFSQAFARLGLIPDAGATWTMPRLVGDARARALFMLAETVTAEQAAQWGMIWKAVDDASLKDEAIAICARLAAVPGHSLPLIKQALLASETNELGAQLAVEAASQKQAGAHPDYRAAVESFRAKH